MRLARWKNSRAFAIFACCLFSFSAAFAQSLPRDESDLAIHFPPEFAKKFEIVLPTLPENTFVNFGLLHENRDLIQEKATEIPFAIRPLDANIIQVTVLADPFPYEALTLVVLLEESQASKARLVAIQPERVIAKISLTPQPGLDTPRASLSGLLKE